MKHTDTIWYPQVALSSPVMVHCRFEGLDFCLQRDARRVLQLAWHDPRDGQFPPNEDGGPRWGKNMQTWAKDGKTPSEWNW